MSLTSPGNHSLSSAVSDDRRPAPRRPGRDEVAAYYFLYIDRIAAERVVLSRALWFARGFQSALPSYDQVRASAAADADRLPWARHVAEFRAVRIGALARFENLPEESWDRRGIASDNPFSVRGLAYIIAGHLDHHLPLPAREVLIPWLQAPGRHGETTQVHGALRRPSSRSSAIRTRLGSTIQEERHEDP